jgi:formiminotetrahydrofolate cyclodeaminase
MAARLVTMAARSTKDWTDGAAYSAQALTLSARLEPLALADAQAYADALQALADRDRGLGEALHRAAELPLAIATAAADVAALAAETAERCAPHVRGEALAAVALARGATEAAGRLVEINLSSSADDDRMRRAAALSRTAREAWERTAER